MYKVRDWSVSYNEDTEKCLVVGHVEQYNENKGWMRPLEIRVTEDGYSVQTINYKTMDMVVLLECETFDHIRKSEYKQLVRAVCLCVAEFIKENSWMNEVW